MADADLIMPQALFLAPSRRQLLAAGGLLIAMPALAAAPSGGRLRFDVLRGGERIGEHVMTFVSAGDALTVTTRAAMRFKIGPLGVDYDYQARESWRRGEFQASQSASQINAKRETVSAARTAGGIEITTEAGVRTVAAATRPLSHWHVESLSGPLFNPANGKLLKVTVSRTAALLPSPSPTPAGARWSLRGAADIDDWYDSDGVWSALRGRLPDRSIVEYRRA